MTDIQTHRQLVLARLGAPAAQISGESYRHRSRELDRIYDRFGEYVDESVIEGRPEQALESFITYLEAEREHDYEAFHYGRELLLDDLCVYVERPTSDPDPEPVAVPSTTETRALPRWSRRTSARGARGARGKFKPALLRARVLEQLGHPHGRIPGEGWILDGTAALDEITEYFDQFDYTPFTAAHLDEALERLIAMRERDFQAFYYGRGELLGLLPIKVDVPPPMPVAEHRLSA
ncbi:hypothetical protein [Enhygromyxa salina]|nr:hypothetical protein [Enhygromyxa salina]